MSLSTDGYFKLFGIKNVAELTKHELTRRYRRLALKYHPDKCNDSGVRFREIHKAYSYIGKLLSEFLKEDSKKFYNPEFHFYGDGSIYSIKEKRWIRLKGKDGNWIKLKRKVEKK